MSDMYAYVVKIYFPEVEEDGGLVGVLEGSTDSEVKRLRAIQLMVESQLKLAERVELSEMA